MIKIDTSLVRMSASQIDTYNSECDRKLRELCNSVNRLGNSWNSSAAEKSRYAFRKIESTCYEGENEVRDIVRYLHNVVGVSYETVEASISTAAEEFR